EDGIKSFHAALQRYEPQLWEEYINFAKNPKNFDEEQINLLKDKFRQINKPRIEESHLGIAISKKTAPYFGCTYRIALQKSFPEIFSSQFSRSKDAAMLSSQGSNITEHPGGIDLNPDILDLREHGVKIRSSYFSNLNFNQFKEVQGFVPVIINISTPTGLVSPHF
ncbi:MAG: hypothetical protein KC618_05145, partial [Candidatus Omnitrophica bacterium]|nr:hypothetical protein [Candidatus Omnitrophota bacterium]